MMGLIPCRAVNASISAVSRDGFPRNHET
jgi:hypothetical protein